MLTPKEAGALADKGEEQIKGIFERMRVEVPDYVSATIPTIPHATSMVLGNTRETLEAKEDEGRKSLSGSFTEETHPGLYAWWEMIAEEAAGRWLRRFPHYFQTTPVASGRVQVIHYRQGDYFRLHMDSGWFPPDIYRVVMVNLCITPSTDYEGGDLVFPTEADGRFKMDKGDVLVFPACAKHLVEEITKGERRVLLGNFMAPMSDEHLRLYEDQFNREIN